MSATPPPVPSGGRDERLDPDLPRDEPVMLTCRLHRDLRWVTENVGHIGASPIWFARSGKPECACPMSDLLVVR